MFKKEPIAIVGIGCRTPGDVTNPADLWKVLLSGVDGVSTVPADRWKVDEYYDPKAEKAGKIVTRRGGFISGIDRFDHEFFKIFPREAERIDPQQRLLLQATFEALEDGGEKLEHFRGSRTAVYMGVFMNDYWDIQVDPGNRYSISPHVPMGVSLTSLANRISYCFDLHGPSISIDTACSSSLVAVHLACQSIWRDEAASAVAGGVNIMINPESTVMMSKGGFLSPDGTCKSFDESANGYVRSEGVGVIFLKPLSAAVAAGNQIYGLIRGTACNSDGFTPDGFTVPSATAQTNMLRAAYRDAGLEPSRVQFVEAHGTGTPVGDPLETRAFANVFGNRPADAPLLIGSVKSNIGHLEGAAGVTGLIKLALCLHHKKIPGNLHFRKGNPKIDFEGWRLKVVDQTMDWPEQADGSPRLGGVNSFGAGGTNAHVVVEEYCPSKGRGGSEVERGTSLFTLSAQTAEALRTYAATYKDYIQASERRLTDICYTAGMHRSTLRHRLAIVARDSTELAAKLDSYISGRPDAGIETATGKESKPRVGFVFTGQGPQWFAMGRELMQKEPVFEATVRRIDDLFSELAGWSLWEEMSRPESESRVSDTRIAQPAIMAVQIGLVELWKHFGVEPEGVVGHSIGEVAAAYTAGALTLEQAVQVIYHRSRGQHAATGKGLMLAVGLELEDAKRVIAPFADVVSIAAVNGPASITLSGDEAPLREIAANLEARDVFSRFLKVSVPFHSHHMDPLKEELIASLANLKPEPARISLYSTVTGKRETGLHLDSRYWFDNVREPVYFSPALEAMLEDGFDVFVEIGPHPALSSGAEELFQKLSSAAQIFPSMRRKEDEVARFLQTAGALHNAGVSLDWDALFPAAERVHDLPRYPWQLTSHWYESASHREHRLRRSIHPHILGHRDSGRSSDIHTFDVLLNYKADPYLGDHRVDNIMIFPATGHLEVATAAACHAFGDKFAFLEDIHFETGLLLPDEAEVPEIRLEVDSDETRFCLMSRERGAEGSTWTRNSTGRMNTLGDAFEATKACLADLQARINDRLPVQPIYNELKQSGLQYGTTFRAIQAIWTAPGELLGKVMLHESLQHGIGEFYLHPSVLDACLHTIFAAKVGMPESERGVFLPVHIQRYRFFSQPKSGLVWSYVRVTESSADFLNGDFVIFDEEGTVVAELQGLRCKYLAGSRKKEGDLAYSGSFEYRWRPVDDLNLKPVHGASVLLIGDAASGLTSLVQSFEEADLDVITLGEGPETEYPVDLMDRQSVRDGFAAVRREYPSLSRIVVALPLGQSGTAELTERIEELSWKILNINHAVMANELQSVVWTLCQRAERIAADDEEVNLAVAPVFGLARVMTNEYPMAISKIVDLSTLNSEECKQLAALVGSTSSGGNETEWAIRAQTVYVKRLEKVNRSEAQKQATVEVPGSGAHYEAFFAEPGNLDSVSFRQFAAQEPGAHDVEIAVKAAALNFKDVLNGMGLLSAESVEGGLVGSQLGLECSGVVTRVGRSVTRFKPGDEVLAIAPRSLAGSTTTPEHCVVHKPAHLSFEQAATITIVYLTAYHCLHDLAQIEHGERLLIHSGTGGVGIAAICLAQLAGAEVYATAGSESKRQLLRDMGVEHVYDSRTLDFYNQIMADTNGEGVDVVLNSLSGKAIVQSIKCLRRFGRFVEIGKTDIYRDAALHLKRFGENLSYFAVDVDRLMAQKPVRGAKLFANVMRLFEERLLQPHPYQPFPITKLADALDFLAKGKHIGKVVLTMDGEIVPVLPAQSLELNPRKVYLITGGASGFGIELARWMAAKGARKLMLISRSGPKSDYDRMCVEAMRQEGVEVMLPQVDLSVLSSVRRCIEQAKAAGPIGGVIHGAALLRDSTIANMDRALFTEVYGAKAESAWNLHKALDGAKVDFFLMLSSISSVFGLPGQSNYSAANNFIDSLVRYRNTQGLAAQSVNLGVLGQYAGMSKQGGSVLNVLESQGWLPLSLAEVTAGIERTILDGGVVRMVANVEWQRFREFFGHLRSDGRFAHLLTDEALSLKGKASGGEGLREKIQPLDAVAAENLLSSHLRDALARILGAQPEKIDCQAPVSAIGLDSLMMNQLRNWIHQKLEINYPLMKMAKGPSIAELAAQLRIEIVKAPEVESASGDTSGIATDQDIEIVNGWFVCRKQRSKDKATVKLFMVHSMGAGASMFSHFLFNPPPGCEVYCVQLPGRENRSGEAAYRELPLLLADLERAIVPLLDSEFAIYGHSFGGIIAFETVRLLRRKYGLHPVHFFASATMAPQITLTWKNRDVMRESTISANSEQKLIGLMSYIDDMDFVKTILPGMRRDMPLLMGYDYQPDEPFSCPITVFSAIEDEVTLAAEMQEWETQTSAQFRQELVHGDHWFVSRNKEFIGKQLALDLAALPEKQWEVKAEEETA